MRNFVVATSFETDGFGEANFIQVIDVLTALQQLVAWHRSLFSLPVIGITGSNGKTIVKDWLFQLMEPEYKIVRSPKSYNSQVGVPLSVWQMNETHTLGIFEAGISQPNEMEALQNIIQPQVGILTHLGDAHGENFTSVWQKLQEKIKLFKTCTTIIANGDNEMVREALKDLPALFWGKEPENDIVIDDYRIEPLHTIIHVKQATSFDCIIPFIDKASVENAKTCIATLLSFGYSSDVIKDRIALLKPAAMRLELKNGVNQCILINDSYIADIDSFKIAIDFLMQQSGYTKFTVILSDLVGGSETVYRSIASMLQEKGIQKMVAVGDQLVKYQDLFFHINEQYFFANTAALLERWDGLFFQNEAILIKGSRQFKLEKVSQLLEQKVHQTILEINLSAVQNNLRQYQQMLHKETKIMVMVKAFAYGSGSYEIATLLQHHKVDYLTVAYADEGVELRKAGIRLPIMVMNPEEGSLHNLVTYQLEPEVFSFSILSAITNHLKLHDIEFFPVHIKIDTGMHRLGFVENELPALAQILVNSTLSVKSVFTHLAGSEDASLDGFTQYQTDYLKRACTYLEEKLGYNFIKHIANTAAIARHPTFQMDMVRLGIGLYGIDTTGFMGHLQEALSLTTTIAQIKKLEAGETVGYNRRGKLNEDAIIATIRIGYADGFRRNLSNGVGKVLINGLLAPVVGQIAMDMTMVDITDIPNVKEGDKATVFGQGLSVQQVANWAQTIPYEIMTGISQRVQRVYFEE